MSDKRNPFRINTLQNRVENPFDLLTKESAESVGNLNIISANKPMVKTPKSKLFDMLRSIDISRASEYALESNKRAIKKQKQLIKSDIVDSSLSQDEDYLSVSDDGNKENVQFHLT
jgi:hypothetical protein